MVLEPPESVRKLQMALQAKAKGAPVPRGNQGEKRATNRMRIAGIG